MAKVGRPADSAVSATRAEQTVLINRKIPLWVSFPGWVVVWADVRVVLAEAKAKAKAREEAATVALDECVIGCPLNILQLAG